MYWGSVRFYKHLIYLAIGLALIVPSIFSLNLYIKNLQISKELEAVKVQKIADLYFTKQNEIDNVKKILLSDMRNAARGYGYSLDYQDLYPNLYVGDLPLQSETEDTIYLSFDDGPSYITEGVLDVLNEKGIKATFFIVGKNLESERGRAILGRIVHEGHGIGIHSYSHVYTNIYHSVDNFLKDFYKVFNQIYDLTGIKPEIFRFPGGSINSYNSDIYKELIAEMTRRGFVHYDWNVSSQDARLNTTVQEIYNSVVYRAEEKDRSIVLMHDSSDKINTLKALPDMIDELVLKGFEFDILTRNVAPISFGYSD